MDCDQTTPQKEVVVPALSGVPLSEHALASGSQPLI